MLLQWATQRQAPREGANLTLDGIWEEVQQDAGVAKLHLPAWLSGAWGTLGYGPLLVCWVN